MKIPNDRFVQICTSSLRFDDMATLFALDEGGGVWEFDFLQSTWVPLSRARGYIEPVVEKVGA